MPKGEEEAQEREEGEGIPLIWGLRDWHVAFASGGFGGQGSGYGTGGLGSASLCAGLSG